jgi:hypothetical protein
MRHFTMLGLVVVLAGASGCSAPGAGGAEERPLPPGTKPVHVHGSSGSSWDSMLVQDVEESPGDVEVPEAPPAPQVERIEIATRPSLGHVWIHGHWAWRGRWVWFPGHWFRREPGRNFVGGHWEAHEGRFRWVAGSWVAEEDVTEERPGLLVSPGAPPAPYQEVVQAELRPSPRHVWIPGHWAWHGHWVWIHGHWHLGHPGQQWIRGHWIAQEGAWHWAPGRWQAEVEMAEERPGELEAGVPPPAPYQETVLIETRPAPNYVWIHGHWAWHGHWVWEHGHWHPNHAGSTFVQGRWVAQGGRWHWVAGNWVVDEKVVEERPGLLEATEAPPAPYQETVLIETRPSPNHVWIHGHWSWHGHWVWEHGHWQLGRAGSNWVQGRWANVDGKWRWNEGNWVEEAKLTAERPGLLEATGAPPAPMEEAILVETRPSPNHVWIHGHWSWHGHWVWEHGHWQPRVVGRNWIQGHWGFIEGHWRWTEGSWIEEAKLTEERPALLEANVAPPPPYRETVLIETRPARNYIWINGHWAWHGHWYWEHGHWHPGPVGHSAWESGRWEARGNSWHWTGGHWR